MIAGIGGLELIFLMGVPISVIALPMIAVGAMVAISQVKK
jgi:hypothetical protein